MEKQAFKERKRKRTNFFTSFFIDMLMKYPWIGICLVVLICIIIFCVGLGSASYTSSRIVRFGLKDVGELTTQIGYFTNVQVIKNSKDLYGWKIPLTTSKYIFSYDGTVKAGIDFAAIEINVDELNNVIKVTLPEAEIFSLEIDPDSMEIYDETKSIFTPLALEDINNSLSLLQEDVRKQAIGNNILGNAYENAKLIVENMISKSHDMTIYSLEFI